MGHLKRRIIKDMEPKEEPPMDILKVGLHHDDGNEISFDSSEIPQPYRDVAVGLVAEVQRLTAEVIRLRITDEEREAIESAIDRFEDSVNGTDDPDRAAALYGLLDRHCVPAVFPEPPEVK